MLYLLGIFVLFLLILFVRALLFRPKDRNGVPALDVKVDIDRAVDTFCEMIKCRTVSYDDRSLQDEGEFEKFRALLDERYPAVAKYCEKHFIKPAGVIYHWKGKGTRTPWVLMAHYDVVPVEEDMWSQPPFSAVMIGGEIWGRGTVDTKCTLLSVMEAAETLIGQGYEPQNDVYLAFGGDEELSGMSAQAMVRWFEERGISPTVIDEGGAIIDGVFPGVLKSTAVIGTGEKGITNIGFTLEGKGGHASTPAPHTPVGVMAKAVAAVEKKPFRGTIVPPVADLFDTIGRNASFGMKLIFSNLWCFKSLLFALAKRRGGELNAMMRTTCAFTKMDGGTAWNVIPPKVTAGANLRLLNHTPEEVVRELERKIGNDQVKVEVVLGTHPSRYSRCDGEGWETLKETILQTWPEVIVSPYLMMAASDSRHYARISDRVYRFSPMVISKEIRRTIHGHNERIPIESLKMMISFYLRLLQKI
ncbi:MAG: M20/M25/M40 family metallo-hydrolase [Clostridiales bacterium]|nr:M20/M25/M40 family metallo-hydrolase [Clostridiales bacterium]